MSTWHDPADTEIVKIRATELAKLRRDLSVARQAVLAQDATIGVMERIAERMAEEIVDLRRRLATLSERVPPC